MESKQLVFDTTLGPWIADDGTRYVDHVEIENPSPELVRDAAAAHAAGAIVVSEGLDLSHVEADEDSLAALTDAMGEWVEPLREEETGAVLEPGYWTGSWYEGHLLQQAIDEEHREQSRLRPRTLAPGEVLEEGELPAGATAVVIGERVPEGGEEA